MVELQEEDIGMVQLAITTSELDMEALKALTTSYTAVEDTDNQSKLDSKQDTGAIAITLKSPVI